MSVSGSTSPLSSSIPEGLGGTLDFAKKEFLLTNTWGGRETTWLHHICDIGYTPTLEEILPHASAEDLSTVDKHRWTPLHYASASGHAFLVKKLLDALLVKKLPNKDANVDPEIDKGLTPLRLACLYNHEMVAKLLLKAGAKPNIKDGLGRTPAHIAASKAHLPCLQVLHQYNADLTAVTYNGQNPLNYLFNNAFSPDNIEGFLNSKTIQTPLNETLKYRAFSRDEKELLSKGPFLSAEEVATHIASTIEFLITTGKINPDHIPGDGMGAIHRICSHWVRKSDPNFIIWQTVLDLFLAKADVNLPSWGTIFSERETPIFIAAKRGSVPVVKLLIEYGAVVKPEDLKEIKKSFNGLLSPPKEDTKRILRLLNKNV